MEKSPVCKKETVTSHHPCLNPDILEESVKKKVAHAFQNGIDYDDSVISIASFPFTHGVIKKFLIDEKRKNSKNPDPFLQALKSELLQLDFQEKSNDLYKFIQSPELVVDKSDSTGPVAFRSRKKVEQVCSLMRESVLPWIRMITGAELSETMDMFCAQYKNTDVLLCHDDELENRRIAYIFYLTEDWTESDGGSLDLFGVNENGDPDSVVKSLVPSFNCFTFFEVSPISFHQVSEILAQNKTRLSLSGWFYGTPLTRPHRTPSPRPLSIRFLPAFQDTDLLSQWVNPGYLNIGTQGTIQEQFEGSSEIQLPGFLLSEKYKELSKAFQLLSNFNEFWTCRGPPNKRKYHTMLFDRDFTVETKEYLNKSERQKSDIACGGEESNNNLENIQTKHSEKIQVPFKTMEAYELINEFIRLFSSEEMFLYLSNITGLSFHPMAANVEDEEESDTDSDIPIKRARVGSESGGHKEENMAGVNSKCRYEVRCWSQGSYTLLRDTDSERGEFALDVNLHCCAEGWQQDFGGYTTYIAQGEDVELLTVLPSSNCLSLAYRDSDAIRFVKHINQRAKYSFFDISFVYYE